MEIWKDILGYNGMYQISDLGRAKSLCGAKERVLKPALISSGYLAICIRKDKIQKTFTIHKLVAIAFLNHKPCKQKLVVNHVNFDKSDNRAVNLEIVTTRENTNRKHIKSTSKYTGVYWDKIYKRWRSSIIVNKKTKHLGRFINEYDAHLAYQTALSELI